MESDLKLTYDSKNFKKTVNYTGGSTLKIGVITWTGCEAKVIVPNEKVSIYVAKKSGAAYKKVSSGTTIKKGYRIKFTAPFDFNAVISIFFESAPTYDAYAITYDTYQDIGFLGTSKTIDKQIDITWKSGTYLRLEKSLNTSSSNYQDIGNSPL